VTNPFRVLIVLAVIVAIALSVGFVYFVFVNPAHPSAKSLGQHTLVESA
jgi:hypothetical protein